ncbi:hypothetical protein NPIL_281231 [Nephila pilipes]|uniref:Uncharacterized protein n=1 Tax=Nephila pilipes TaxID=299642 RepID=A0A8X6KG99_NEPPI|nr:hypothetical protein NPIL_281231 [Nephila pilipes]
MWRNSRKNLGIIEFYLEVKNAITDNGERYREPLENFVGSTKNLENLMGHTKHQINGGTRYNYSVYLIRLLDEDLAPSHPIRDLGRVPPIDSSIAIGKRLR